MNRKFVKENKKALREFLGGIVSSLLTGKMKRNVYSDLMKNPEIRKQKTQLDKLATDFEKKVDKIKFTNPSLYRRLKQIDS